MSAPPEPLGIAAAEVAARLQEEPRGFVLVDVRETVELDRGILPGAVSIPLSVFPEKAAALDPAREVICTCEHGVRSLQAAAYLRQQGYRARSLDGGFAAWPGPVETWQG